MTTVDGDELLALGSATLYEASGLDCAMDPRIRPSYPGARVCGSALPVLTAPEDNLALHVAIEQARPGDVLVVNAAGLPRGYWGEVLTAAAQAAGIRGLVIDGGVRDVDQLAARGFPTFSRWVAIPGTTKHWDGLVGAPITVGGVPVGRGDTVVADTDGVVVVPAVELEGALARARARADKEAEFLDRIERGQSTMDLYGFRRVGTP